MTAYKEKVDAADIVSFDVFDTLLIRNVARPADVFRIVKENFNQFTPYHMSANFVEARIRAEHLAYQRSANAQHANLDDIYAQFQKMYGYDKEFCKALQEMELATERGALRVNPRVKAIYDYAFAQGKRIFIVSDMYLPKQAIASALKANGYGHWDEIIVSCHDKFSKHDGSAYAHIREKYARERIVHIGDNEESDVAWAKAYGIEAIHIEQDLQELSYETTKATQTARGGKLLEITNIARHTVNDAQQSVVTGLIAHKMVDPHMTELESIGYGALGPLLLGFVQWLHDTARIDKRRRLFFAARDGAIMQRAYTTYYGAEALPNEYVFASRRLYNFAKIADQLTAGDVDFLTASDAPLAVRAYFERFGVAVDHPAVVHALSITGLKPTELIDKGASHKQLRAAFVLATEAIRERSAEERLKLLDYFRSVNFKGDEGDATIDIGWHGSLQWSLMDLLGAHGLKGYYFGLHDAQSTRTAGDTMAGFIDERHPSDEVFYRMIRTSKGPVGIEVVEYLFTNPDQESVTAIERDGKTFRQVLRKKEKTEDELLADTSLRAIQASAIQFIEDYKHATEHSADTIRRLDRAVAFQELSLLIQEPSDQQAIVIGRVKHSLAEGLPPRSIGMPVHDVNFYRMHPNALRQEYERAYWKEGFKKNVSIMQLDRYL